MERPAQFLQEIVCPICPQQGHATWDAATKTGALRQLVTLSNGFHVLPESSGENLKITCKQCGATQAD